MVLFLAWTLYREGSAARRLRDDLEANDARDRTKQVIALPTGSYGVICAPSK
jgi:hypothetical protein